MAWGHGHFQIRRRATNLFIFRFYDWDSYNTVLEEGPWSVDGYLAVFREWNTSINPDNLDFLTQQFWIDIKKLPPEFLNAKVENQVASILGNPLKLIPEDGNPTDTNAVSVLIEFNISNPMFRGLMAEKAAKVTQWIPIHFQRQPRNLVLHASFLIIMNYNVLISPNMCKLLVAIYLNLEKILVRLLTLELIIPKYKQGEKILISSKKSRDKKRLEKKPFQIPEDGFHVSTIYSVSEQGAESSTARRPKRNREGSATSSYASTPVHVPIQQNPVPAQISSTYHQECMQSPCFGGEHRMYPSFFRPIP